MRGGVLHHGERAVRVAGIEPDSAERFRGEKVFQLSGDDLRSGIDLPSSIPPTEFNNSPARVIVGLLVRLG